MSKEEFEIIKTLLEKLISILNDNNPYMPIILVAVGALLSLSGQGLFWILRLRNERKIQTIELLSEVIRLSQLLKDSYKELVMHKVHKNFWFQSHIYAIGSKYEEIYYLKHLESNKESFKTEYRIRKLFSEYVKSVEKYQLYKGKIEKVEEILKDIKNFVPRKPKEFDNIPDPELRKAEVDEEAELNKIYEKYGDYFDSLNNALKEKYN